MCAVVYLSFADLGVSFGRDVPNRKEDGKNRRKKSRKNIKKKKRRIE